MKRGQYRMIYGYPRMKKGGYLDQYLNGFENQPLELPKYDGFSTNTGYLPSTRTGSLGQNFVQSPQYANLPNAPTTQSSNGGGQFDTMGAVSEVMGAANTLTNLNEETAWSDAGSSIGSAFSSIPVVGPLMETAGKIVGGLAGGIRNQVNAEGDSRDAFVEKYEGLKNTALQTKNKQISQGYGGNYFDSNQSMMAAYGGSLPVLGESYAMGGPISKRYGYTRADLLPISNYNSGVDIMEEGGEIQPKNSMVTEYNSDMSHAENPQGGTAVDSVGNRSVTSNNRQVALIEGNEVSFYSKSKGSSYIFSDKIPYKA